MKTIGIIGAMDLETENIKKLINIASVRRIAGMDFSLGSFEKNSVVVVRCGVGKVNAAICAQILIDLYGVDCIINTGVAGGLDANVGIGDIVISSDVMHHDMDASGLGFAPGVIPDMAVSLFEADKELVSRAKAALSECALKGVVGRVAGGDVFVSDDLLKKHIRDSFGAVCCEMEGSGIAQTCHLNGVPFVIIRAISDSADNAGSMDYPVFKALAAENSQKLVHCIIKGL